jgi:glycosyltransferase involved in cell wall biosynthesis
MSDLVLHTRVVTGSGGGPDKTILNSPRFLAERGYPMLCVYMRDPADHGFAELERRAERWRAPLLAVDDRGPLDWRLRGRLDRLCAERKPAIWHAHDYKSNYLGLRLRRQRPMALVTTVHGWGVQAGWKTALYYRFDRSLVRRYEQVICVSRDLYESCLSFGVPAERCWFVPNAIDTEEFRRLDQPASSPERAAVPAGRSVIGAVGRLSPEKAFDDLIRAAGELIREGMDLELWIVGEGPERRRLEDLVVELGLAERVKLLGYRDDTLELYRAMDIYALSSRREGLPNVLLEAMALELPVVSTRIAGIPRLIEDDANGLLVEPGAIDQLTAALRRVLAETGLAERLGRAARRTIEERHSMAARMERMREIYEVALGRARREA